jgi:hypothetical protein
MRLIDADAFKKLLGTDTKIRETFCKVIDAQPTAYDVEKVVAELEKESFQEFCDSPRIVDLKDAIDIVKRGGAS